MKMMQPELPVSTFSLHPEVTWSTEIEYNPWIKTNSIQNQEVNKIV